MTRPQAPTLALNLGEQISKVLITQADGITITYKLAFGLDAMTPGPFRQDPPTAHELARARRAAEAAVLPLAARSRAHEPVAPYSPVPLAGELGSHELSRESIEQLFGQFTAMVEGDPLAAAHLPKGRHFAAVLLILREWMHHLDAKRVVVAE